jgi:hypothetical protein
MLCRNLARLHFAETFTKNMYGNALLNYADLPGDLGINMIGNQKVRDRQFDVDPDNIVALH